jgi:hypothetical protein
MLEDVKIPTPALSLVRERVGKIRKIKSGI